MHKKTENTISEITSLLESAYQSPNHGNREDPLEELLYILLTIKTDYAHYSELWENFKSKFPTLAAIDRAKTREISSAIKQGGLQKQKASRIKKIVKYLADKGFSDLDFLDEMDTRTAEGFLDDIPGVGKKIARCVLMYSLKREVLPVDSQTIRICKRIGLIPPSKKFDESEYLNSLIPDRLKYSFHVNIIELGRRICTVGTPKCSLCPIKSYCKYGQRGGST